MLADSDLSSGRDADYVRLRALQFLAVEGTLADGDGDLGSVCEFHVRFK